MFVPEGYVSLDDAVEYVARIREPGAGSREPGAGSREPEERHTERSRGISLASSNRRLRANDWITTPREMPRLRSA